MDIDAIKSADIIGMFCRLKTNVKPGIPVRSSEMGVLIYVSKQSSEVTPLMISRFFRISKPTVSSMVNSLIKKGYLDKKSSESDKRSYSLIITDEGDRLVTSAFDDYFRSIELLKEKMGGEKFNQFIELMQIANGILLEAD
jgi:DNA-binding MarR family transcriptional regulator